MYLVHNYFLRCCNTITNAFTVLFTNMCVSVCTLINVIINLFGLIVFVVTRRSGEPIADNECLCTFREMVCRNESCIQCGNLEWMVQDDNVRYGYFQIKMFHPLLFLRNILPYNSYMCYKLDQAVYGKYYSKVRCGYLHKKKDKYPFSFTSFCYC